MENSGSKALLAAAVLVCGCTRAPLTQASGRTARPEPVAASEAVVVATHAASRLSAPEPVHVQRDALTEASEEDAPEEEAHEAELEEDEREVETEGEEGEGGSSYDAVFSEVEVERYEEKESGVTFGPMALYSALVLQRVANYDSWRSAFDAQLPARKRAGFAAQAVLRGVHDVKVVAVWLAATDVTLAKSYLAEIQRSKPAAKSGKPRVQLARNLASKLDSELQGLHAALVTLEVEDLASFRAAFDADAQRRLSLGLAGYALSQDIDNEAKIYVYLQSEASGHLKAYLASHETRRLWHEAGVSSIKGSLIVREGELSLCQ